LAKVETIARYSCRHGQAIEIRARYALAGLDAAARIHVAYMKRGKPVHCSIEIVRIAAKTMIGPNYWLVPALPHDQLHAILLKHGVLKN
jgi:hypothetical protein